MHNIHPLSCLTWLWLLTVCISAHKVFTNIHDTHSGTGSLSALFLARRWNNTTFSNLTLAPYIHNVSTTYAWVLPQNRFDIGAGAMTCECFDPADTCCMPQSTTIGPFCISGNATCCGDAYCNANETCCGGACCLASTTCSVVNGLPGCCPLQTTCTGPPTCLDHFSNSCSNQSSTPAQCCPVTLPACGAFLTDGQACYVSAPANALTTAATSTFTSTLYETMTLVPLGTTGFTDIFPTIFPTPASNEVVSTIWAVDVLSSASPTSTSPTSTSVSSVAGLCDPGPCYPTTQTSTTGKSSMTTTDTSTIVDGPYTLMPTSGARDEKGPWLYATFIPVIAMLSARLLTR